MTSGNNDKKLVEMSDSSSMYTYELITREESEQLPQSWKHCVHVMIHSPVPDVNLFNDPNLTIRNTILMMMRYDGSLGFPGGFADADDKTLEDSVYRELIEEMGDVPAHFKILPSDYMSSHSSVERKYCLHLFIKKVTFEEFLEIETRNGTQEFSGFEVLGPVRVPLFVMSDQRSGLPAFLRNNFVGNSKEQLIHGIREKQLLPDEVLNHYLYLSKQTDRLSDHHTQKNL